MAGQKKGSKKAAGSKKKTIEMIPEKAIEKAIESASGDSEEVNEKTDLDMTCVQIPPSFPEASALKLTWRKLQRRPRTKQQKRSATTRVAVA